jgi:hypothetical protein
MLGDFDCLSYKPYQCVTSVTPVLLSCNVSGCTTQFHGRQPLLSCVVGTTVPVFCCCMTMCVPHSWLAHIHFCFSYTAGTACQHRQASTFKLC